VPKKGDHKGRPYIGRVVRGGSWNNNPRNLRAAQRNRNTDENNNIGFRLARTLSAGAGAITVAPGAP
jgi:formylglycine-generating enzyme required for sulfatase activity